MRFEDRLQQWRAAHMKLPGAPPTRRIPQPDLGDEPTNASRWTSGDLQRAILDHLADAPRAKWELREQLHVNDARIFKELKALRQAGSVKVVGRRLIERRWALGSWQAPVVNTHVSIDQSVPASPRQRQRVPPGAPARGSWWTTASRDGFTEQARNPPVDTRARSPGPIPGTLTTRAP